jgi:tRNA (mo5U34)-methyltransferase
VAVSCTDSHASRGHLPERASTGDLSEGGVREQYPSTGENDEVVIEAAGNLTPGTRGDLRRAVAEVPLWYHTIELAPGVVTPGWFDLRTVAARAPWPDVRGLRCLDVASSDGFLAFELERRGAAEVVSVDIADHEDWDWLPRERESGPAGLSALSGAKGRSFEVAAAALGSSVKRRVTSVYDLSPASLGTFDVVVCGWLMLHLRDPFRALEAIRGVCRKWFLSIEQIDPRLTLLDRRRGAFSLRGEIGQWLVPSRLGVSRMIEVAGFDVVESTRPYATPFGSAHPPVRQSLGRVLGDLMCRGRGVPTVAVLAKPALGTAGGPL